MASHNSWTFSGNLGSDPESRQVGDRQVCNFSVAVNGRRDDPATWVRVAVWGKQAEACQRYLAKGRQVIVTGAARLREYEGRNGKGVSLEVDAREVTFIGGRDDAQGSKGGSWGSGSGQSGGGWGGGGSQGGPGNSGGWGDPAPGREGGQRSGARPGAGAPNEDPIPF